MSNDNILDVFFSKVRTFISNLTTSEFTLYSLFAIITGASVGFAAVVFHNAIDFFNHLFFRQTIEGFYFLGSAAVVILPALGMFIQAMMIKMFPLIAKRKGVAEVIKSVSLSGGKISLRTTIFHFFAPVISIGSGNTVGPEVPAAQLGAGVASKIATLANLSDSKRRIFTAAGSGAAIAAIFNTPLGGIFFAIEVILLNNFQTQVFSALILSTVTASVVSRLILGNTPVFIFAMEPWANYGHFHFFIIFGIITGLLSVLFLKYCDKVDLFFKSRKIKKIPQSVTMVIVGLLVGFCGLYYKDIFGIGYSGINNILSDSHTISVVVILLVMKFVLVPLVLYSGGYGGMFAPALFMGACIGFIFSKLIFIFWGIQLSTTIFILVGMGAVLGGINSIPISAILIIFEMTRDYSFILPLMLVVVLSSMIVQLITKSSIHIKHLEKQGFRIAEKSESSLLKHLSVKDVMKKELPLISDNTPLPLLISEMTEGNYETLFMINEKGIISGVIRSSEIRGVITEYDNLKTILVANDVANKDFVFIHQDDNLAYVLKLFEKKEFDILPVISEDDSMPIGTVKREDVIALLNKETLKSNYTDGIATAIKSASQVDSSSVAKGFSIFEKEIPESFIGKTLPELKLRNNYGIEVLMIKKRKKFFEDEDEIMLPDLKYKLVEGDRLVIFGPDELLNSINLEK